MSVTDEVLVANQQYAANFKLGGLAMPPAKKLAVLACMDARISVEDLLGLKTGDAHIIRNAGGIATEDALRSLIISHHLLWTQEFIVINHTDCGMLTFSDHDLLHKLEENTGVAAIAPPAASKRPAAILVPPISMPSTADAFLVRSWLMPANLSDKPVFP